MRDWLNNFAAVVTKDPPGVGLTPADAATLTALASQYDAAYLRAVEPLTRTSPAIAEKDATRNQAVDSFRVYAMQVKMNLGVPDGTKLALGLHEDRRTSRRLPPPGSQPVLYVLSAHSGTHILRCADAGAMTRRGKPYGVAGLELYMVLGDSVTADSEAPNMKYLGLQTRQRFMVEFEAKDAGRTATYFARWVTRTGLTGPWSLPVSMMVAFGSAPGSASAERKPAAKNQAIEDAEQLISRRKLAA